MNWRWMVCVLWLAGAAACARGPQEQARRYVASGDAFAARGEDAAALLEYRNAVRAWPAWRESHEKLGDVLERLGRVSEAYRAYAQALTIVDGEPLPSDEAGLRRVVAQRPDLAPARIALAGKLLASHDEAGAEAQLRAAADADPGNELANRGLAAIYVARGEMAEAEHRLTLAAAHEPQRYRSRLALADLLLAERRYADARVWLERAADDPALEQAVRLRRAAIDYEDGRVAQAETAVSALVESHPSVRAWTLQGRFQLRDGRLGEAEASAREALALAPDFTPARDLATEIRLRETSRSFAAEEPSQ